ncbi:hypothetical protein SAMN03159341_1153 [Paenibacillus sp. 1_12]|nr:hypothetical protein SAMN03159341_1153 [Paenibacillus sp. 1_12]
MVNKRNMLWWQIKDALASIEENLKFTENDVDVRVLELQKLKTVETVIISLGHLSDTNEIAKLKYQLWLNKGINPRQTANSLGISVGALRAKILHFDYKLKKKVGGFTIESIVAATSTEELEQIMKQFVEIVSTGKPL